MKSALIIIWSLFSGFAVVRLTVGYGIDVTIIGMLSLIIFNYALSDWLLNTPNKLQSIACISDNKKTSEKAPKLNVDKEFIAAWKEVSRLNKKH